MDRIKSSLEIAMERLQKRESSGTDTATYNETDEYVKAAAILGRSFLQGKMKKEEIGEKLTRYPEKIRAAALQALIEELVSKMTLENTSGVLEAIQYLKADKNTKKTCAGTEHLYRQYRLRLEESLAQLAETTTQTQLKELSRRGIRGSAIADINVKNTAAWQQLSARVEEEYLEALESFRRSMKLDSR